MKRSCFLLLVVLVATFTGYAQDQSGAVDSYIESVRADIRADKVAIIGQAMRFTDKESKIFWPIYRKYEAEMTTLNDERISLAKSYADKFAALTDADAKSLTDRALEFDANRVALHKKYVAEFRKAGLSSTTVAKFVQLEHRLDLLIDLKLASELPALMSKPASATTK
jgi:hypothetical protein